MAAAVSQFPLSQHLIEFYCKLKRKYYKNTTENCKRGKQEAKEIYRGFEKQIERTVAMRSNVMRGICYKYFQRNEESNLL